ncbi:DUF6868 family protein [Candidatus Thioglobus autotrophicus]|jgi:hypothetical protein|uniref:DUF6868 family protein n=1 Tax=Candidatus Thioglobus autotrophicus TaxID=1705394 RepID=UPI0006B665D8|nr:hypothetical protein [Candidatus Thioglobus autotrophicus]WPE16142.1 hypothetical protein R5P06_06230 [Candidatus Thioglobus autotrophicus]WPE17579.1 hypothetical protein R5P05_05800 [Candidatus Thioglobus autotrophicus]
MTITIFQSFLGWSLAINIAVLLSWVLAIKYAHDYVYQVHTYWISITNESFNNIHYGGIGLYKLLIVVFNLVPYFALMLVS